MSDIFDHELDALLMELEDGGWDDENAFTPDSTIRSPVIVGLTEKGVCVDGTLERPGFPNVLLVRQWLPRAYVFGDNFENLQHSSILWVREWLARKLRSEHAERHRLADQIMRRA